MIRIYPLGNEQILLCSGLKRISKLKVFVVVLSLSFFTEITAQVGISITSITPDPSSILELRSTGSGFLPPRMTTAQRDAISTPAPGLVVYNTTTNLLNFYNGSSWQISGGSGEPAIVPVNTANKYWNGYKNFVTLNSDSLTEGVTNVFYTTARSNLKLSISDTAAMLSNYRTSYQPIGNYATTAQNNLKLNISDTASMLANYQSAINVNTTNITSNTTGIALKVNISDTAAMLSNY